MPIDPVDNAREEARRADDKKIDARKERLKQASGQDFASRYQGMVAAREKSKTRLDRKDDKNASEHSGDGAKQEEGVFAKVMEVFRGKEGSERDKKELLKKEEAKKEERLEKSPTKETKTTSQEGHQRIDATRSRQQDAQSGHGGGFGGGQQSASHQGGDKNTSSFSQQGQNLSQRGKQEISAPAHSVAGTSFSEAQDEESAKQEFSDKVLDEIVKQVHLRMDEQGEHEMEVTLSDEVFSGLRVKIKKQAQGVIVVLICPDRTVRNIFLINRPKLSQRLREKGIKVQRIDIEG